MITSLQIITGAKFETTIGTIEIVDILKDGFGSGIDQVFTTINGGIKYSDTVNEVVDFLNEKSL